MVVPSFSFAATANAVALTGARPVFADIEPDHFCLDPVGRRGGGDHADRRDHARCTSTAIPRRWAASSTIAAKHGLAVVEDAAQAHLAALDGRPVGTFGAVAAFSFYPTKNMTAGEGGMVVCADEAVARTVRLLRNQGMERRYANEIVGYNMRMTDLHAAIGRVQLDAAAGPDGAAQAQRRVPRHARSPRGDRCWWCRRRRRAPSRCGTSTPSGSPIATGWRSSWPTGGWAPGVYYPTPIHRLPAYALDARPARDRAGRGRGALPPGPPGAVTRPSSTTSSRPSTWAVAR